MNSRLMEQGIPRQLDLFQPEEFLQRQLWAVGGGKGGTGKSFISANMAVTLSQMGKRVLLVDADLGCANLHTFLGVEPRMTLSDFLQGKVDGLEKVLTPTPHANLFLLSGAHDCLDILNSNYVQNEGFVRDIQKLQFEHIILDLGAGTSPVLLDFFVSADSGILSVIPEPTSIENTYRFIKSAFYRHFKRWVQKPHLKQIITEAMHRKEEYGIQTPCDLVNYVASLNDGDGEVMKENIFSFSPRVIVNQVRHPDDITLGFSMRSACAKYFGIRIKYVGYIHYDDHIWQAVRKKVPLVLESPYSTATQQMRRVVSNLIQQNDLKLEAVFKMAKI